METKNSLTPEQLRCWKRWVRTLEAMLWVLQTAPMSTGKDSRDIDRSDAEEDRSLCVYLRDLCERGRQTMREPMFNRQLQSFEAEYRAATAAFYELQRERDPEWKL